MAQAATRDKSEKAPKDAEGDGLTRGQIVLASASAAATGAVLSTILFYPIELVKNRLQAAARGKASFAYKGMVDGLRTIWLEEGIRGMFVGVGSIASRCLVSDFLTFYFSDLLLAVTSTDKSQVAALPLKFFGTVMSVLISLPLEIISTRVTVSREPITTLAATRQLWKEGGLGAFWRGTRVMTVLCINPALTMCSYDWLRRLVVVLRKAKAKAEKALTEDADLHWSAGFAVGASAKLVTLCLVYPLIRGKFVLQGHDTQGAGLFQVLAELRRKEGIRSWYSGLDAQLSKSLLSSALLFATKERTEASFRRLVASRK
mmetsp:Transcript_11127/g.20219  ORF Transcript_11127/g.20219 Transcript_11127/m.20219 type:complete len:317 (-) Transcript_11127:46-996(-)